MVLEGSNESLPLYLKEGTWIVSEFIVVDGTDRIPSGPVRPWVSAGRPVLFFPEPEQLLGPLSPYSQGRAAGNPFDSPRRIHGDNQRVCGH